MTNVLLRQDVFGRWIVVHAEDQEAAWSGMQWVPIDAEKGLPAGPFQVSNFEERGQAQSYAEAYGFEVTIE